MQWTPIRGEKKETGQAWYNSLIAWTDHHYKQVPLGYKNVEAMDSNAFVNSWNESQTHCRITAQT